MQRLNVWLSVLASSALLAASANALKTDTDNDGVTDDLDNCILVAQGDIDQPGSCDSDSDGSGNACDADFDQNGFVGFSDLQVFRDNFGMLGDNVADLDCNGFVNFDDLARFAELFGTNPGPSEVNCNVADIVAAPDSTADWEDVVDNEPGGTVNASVYLRGTFGPGLGFGVAEDGYNNFVRPASPAEGGPTDVLIAQFAVAAAEHKYKIADTGWQIERGDFVSVLNVDSPLVLSDTTATCDSTNAPISVPLDGCYNFELDASNILSLNLSMTAIADAGCPAPTSIGGDELSNGERVYIRGGLINDWGAVPGSNDFVNTGGGADQREAQFALLAGDYGYKVANSSWSFERSTCGDADPPPQILAPGETVKLVDLTQNSTVVFPEDACYQMELDITNGTDNPTVTLRQLPLN